MGRNEDRLNQDQTVLGGLGAPAQPRVMAGEVLLRTGNRLSCLICGAQEFARREVMLNTSGMTFMGLDWANRTGDGAICRACGFVHTFLDGELTWGG